MKPHDAHRLYRLQRRPGSYLLPRIASRYSGPVLLSSADCEPVRQRPEGHLLSSEPYQALEFLTAISRKNDALLNILPLLNFLQAIRARWDEAERSMF